MADYSGLGNSIKRKLFSVSGNLGVGSKVSPEIQGNLDLNNRPVVKNPDKTISTVRSITITDDNRKAILIPTVVGNKVVSNDEAIQHYKNTGENLGTFNNEKIADIYARLLHNQQAKKYEQ